MVYCNNYYKEARLSFEWDKNYWDKKTNIILLRAFE